MDIIRSPKIVVTEAYHDVGIMMQFSFGNERAVIPCGNWKSCAGMETVQLDVDVNEVTVVVLKDEGRGNVLGSAIKGQLPNCIGKSNIGCRDRVWGQDVGVVTIEDIFTSIGEIVPVVHVGHLCRSWMCHCAEGSKHGAY